LHCLLSGIIGNKFLIFVILLSVLVIAGVHPAQLLWYLIAFLGYYLLIRHAEKNPFIFQREIDKDYSILTPIIGVLIIVILLLEFTLTGNLSIKAILKDPINYVSIPIMFGSLWLLSRLLNQTANNNAYWNILLVVITVTSLYFVIDWAHLGALFIPSMEAHGVLPHLPRFYTDSMGVSLSLPSWAHQLRWGLLYSGVLAIPVAIYLLTTRRDRGSYFLASAAVIGFLGIVSPYYYTALFQLIPYNSMYRIHLLIFTPLIFSLFYVHAWEMLKKND
jgi:hypothetical protein